ncbi:MULTISPECIES: IS3 family transposase [Actinomycetes]|uniref:IS3 family transposase n=2 Tax=Actinomycetes TaxID=1760 RepID=A0A255EPU8_9ACTN|nr:MULTISPECIES: IS3 family transposase [Actinomycetes]EBV1615219.1 IS3 family transposase [Salmonella enterica subsp. enterica serovar Ibadan]EEJ1748907.1 IS3 family transposase [Salmonella enterica subsp. enterica]MBU8794620.1 IS3 family transposase [Micrococcus luteus]MCT1872058.1 IS3 family transposase [Micrococcus luteus]OYN90153.1 IS3 family transposase [Parenemella sanctibonifatiensis]
MARKNYSEEFRRQAVDLYESTPGATVRGIAEDLGIVRGTLRHWLEVYGTGKKTAADGTLTSSPLQSKPSPTSPTGPAGETPEQKIARLEARVNELEVETTKLTTEREILQRAAKYFAGGDGLVSRFQFVADNSATFEVKRLCELVEIERSSYYAWLKAAPAREARAADDAALAERIRAVHAEDNTQGAPRITAELNDSAPAGERVNHKRVARVMRLQGIRGYVKKRRVRTTIPEPSGQKYPDLLKRDFTAPAPGLRYVGDITYLPIADGTNLYLATVIDCYSRRLVGWAIADHMRTELVEDALKAAAATRGTLKGSVFHSDHGSVYCSKDYAKLCRKLGVTQSMGAVGSSADNALAESFNATMKREVLQDAACWSNELVCRRQVFRWLVRYNTKRRHSWCRYVPPVLYETGNTATLPTAA